MTTYFIEDMKNKRIVRLKKQKKGNIVLSKILFTVMVMLVYICGRCIPLFGIDYTAYSDAKFNADNLLLQTIGGDIYKTSIFALGIAPFITGSIIIQMVAAIKKVGDKSQTSPKIIGKMTVALVLVIALIQAYTQVNKLEFVYSDGIELLYAKVVAFIEMVTGALVLMRLTNKNKKYGIGGQTAIIFVNIIDGITKLITRNLGTELIIPILISILALIVMLIMENVEIRIPVQRIAIQSIYADKNYMAIKANPVGVMPIMFASAAFMLPQAIIGILASAFPYKTGLAWLNSQMNLSCMTGIITYLVLLYALTIVFAILFIDPSGLSEQFLKSGDSIVNLHSGPDTKKYIYKVLSRVCVFSATVMALCAGVPLLLKYYGVVDGKLSMLPTSVMMLSGLFYGIYQEFLAVKSFDEYVPFL